MSDKFIFTSLCFEKRITYIIQICELNEKFLFIKCLFPLIEELIKIKFDIQLNKLNNLTNKIEKDIYIKNILEKYYKGHEDEINQFNKIFKNNYIIPDESNSSKVLTKSFNSFNILIEILFIDD